MSEIVNYRNAYKSDHLGRVDLEEFYEQGLKTEFTIKEVKQYIIDPNVKGSGVKVAGKTISANIAFFKEDIKPWVINSGNADIIRPFAGSISVTNWKNIRIELYVDPTTKLKGQVVGGIKVRNRKIDIVKESMNPEHKLWEKLVERTKENGSTIEQIREHYDITQENYDLLCG